MRYLARSIVFGFALLGATASAQNVDPRLSKLDARTRSAVAAIIDSARVMDLPTAPLIDKALEGAAKRANGSQIVSAVRTFVVQLGQARSALGMTSTEGELIGGAQAIRAGIPVQQLERLRKVRPGVQIAAALTVVSDLVAREVPMDTAVSVVAHLVRVAASDDQLLGVRAEIENDILVGLPPAVAATSRGDALVQTIAGIVPPNGAGTPGTLPSPSGTNRVGEPGTGLKPPSQAVGNLSGKPPVQRKRPNP
jgi:hypothetical protein